jgi:hypothetical protein
MSQFETKYYYPADFDDSKDGTGSIAVHERVDNSTVASAWGCVDHAAGIAELSSIQVNARQRRQGVGSKVLKKFF